MQRPAAKTLTQNPFLALLREVKPDLDQRVARHLEGERPSAEAAGPAAVAMLRESQELSLRGGKRLRGALVLAGLKATESRTGSWERALRVGAAVELLQSYFLIHDDWMDQDATRRGGPSVHTALAKHFRDAHKGACGAILAGDYLVALATRVLVEATKGHRRQSDLLGAFAEMQLAAVLGQQLDSSGTEPEAEKVYELKTASYTVFGPLHLGALLGGASPRALRGLERFSKPLGVAFQLRDDLLSLFASPKQTGKPFANDLREGKQTWIVQWTMSQGSTEQRRAVRKVFGMHSAKSVDVRAAVKAIKEAGAEAATEARLRELTALSLQALKQARFSANGDALLRGAARAFVERRS